MSIPCISRIAVFCGSSTGSDHSFIQACTRLAEALYSRRIGLVYGGGNIGLMGILADEMLSSGCEVIGVIPQKLVDMEVAHINLSRLHIVPGMHERKAMMAELSDAFIVMPGGIGTMDEFFEMYTWLLLGYHNKPIGLLNTNGFFDMLIGFIGHMAGQGFLQKNKFDQLIIDENPSSLVDSIIKKGLF